MAKKATITPVTDTVNNAAAINTQLNAINNKLDNTLSLDGSVPNAMGADLDVNSNDILNAKNIYATDIVVAGNSVAASAAASAASASNASDSEVAAAQSAALAELAAGTERATMVTRIAGGFVPTNAVTYHLDGLQYLGVTGSTRIADLPGLEPTGVWSIWHFNVVGDGVADDGAAVLDAFKTPVFLTDHIGGTYRISARSIPITHPSSFIGAGTGNTSFIFDTMGGFAGLDGFVVSVPVDAEYGSTTEISHCDVLVSGADGRYGIKTPVNEGGGGATLFYTVRPRFVFSNMNMGGAVRLSVGANLHTVNGWMKCIYSGESDNSEFTSLTFMQPFWAPNNPATWGDKINTSGIHLHGLNGATGGGPIRNPHVEHIVAHGCGAPFRTTGYTSTLRISNCDTFANYYGGIVHDTALFTDGLPSMLSEASISNVQFNGIAGGCKIKAADYLTINDADITDTSFGSGVSVTYATTWVGIDIIDEIRELTLYSPRFYAARATATNDHRGVRATMATSASNPSFLFVNDVFVRNATASPPESHFTKVFELVDANYVSIKNVFFSGNVQDVLSLSGTLWLSPRVDLIAQKSAAVVGNLITLGGSLTFTNVRNLSAPIVGTVRTSDATIPDAIMEVGGAANDRWVKYESGWMTQTRVISGVAGPTTAAGSIFQTAENTFTFTEAFIEPPDVKCSVRSGAGFWANSRAISATQGGFNIFYSASSSATRFVELTIEGRWK